MCPYIFGFIDSYILCIAIGIIVAFFILYFYFKNNTKLDNKEIIDVYIISIFSIIGGIIFAILFENLYELIDKGSLYKWTWGMTFLGGLFGGVVTFFSLYFIYGKKRNMDIKNILIIAPSAIAIGHAFGRIGCFLHGCCYGKETTSWIGVKFSDLAYKVIPIQLFEAFFLFVLGGILFYFAIKKKYPYTLPIYLGCYAVFRFIIEFFRGDYRGGYFLHLSPSQWLSLILLVVTPLIFYILKNKVFNVGDKHE